MKGADIDPNTTIAESPKYSTKDLLKPQSIVVPSAAWHFKHFPPILLEACMRAKK
jgi:hypothetical protein